jgi:hypothetical protein
MGLFTQYQVRTPLVDEARSVADIERAYAEDRWHAWRPPSAAESNLAREYQQLAWRYMSLRDRDTFLYRFLQHVLREHHHDHQYPWVPQDQGRGTCVGQGHKLGADIVMAVNALVSGVAFKGRAAVAPIYTGSRVEVAGKPGPWDGSNGVWACRWLREWGVVLLGELELPDHSRREDERLAVRWTASRAGVPQQFERLARERPVLETPLVREAREAGKAIQAGHPVVQCSTVIPDGRRDERGFSHCRASGGHCTALTAVRYDPFGLLYQNSWDGWGSGPGWPNDQPPGSVWINEPDANRMLQQNDSHALVGISGLEPIPDDLLL